MPPKRASGAAKKADKKGRSSGRCRSMTGFGKAEAGGSDVSVSVDIRAVNHRFLDLNVKLPREYFHLEPRLREIIGGRLTRGRVDVYVRRATTSISAISSSLNKVTFNSWLKVAKRLIDDSKILAGASDAARADVYSRLAVEAIKRSESGGDEAPLQRGEEETCVRAVQKALDQLVAMREREGEKLCRELTGRAAELHSIRESLERQVQRSQMRMQSRLRERVQKLVDESGLDPSRVSAEALILAERMDVSEELSRLQSHLQEFEATLQGAAEGKRLDFLVQEMGRELTTLGNKAQDADVQRLVVDGKLEAERIREQIQNIE